MARSRSAPVFGKLGPQVVVDSVAKKEAAPAAIGDGDSLANYRKVASSVREALGLECRAALRPDA